jgi:hypothetical protein
MYGIVNKAIEELVIENFGEKKWEAIKERSSVDLPFFVSNEPYPDDITYRLASAVFEEMNMSLSDVLVAFGEWWVLRTSKQKYGSLMDAGGTNLKEFLLNLPAFHNRIMLIYPKLMPPEFRITELGENSIWVHYYSQREGLQDFVRGLLQGLGKMYETPVSVTLMAGKNETLDHDVFEVCW